jgi:hypothetical protein
MCFHIKKRYQMLGMHEEPDKSSLRSDGQKIERIALCLELFRFFLAALLLNAAERLTLTFAALVETGQIRKRPDFPPIFRLIFRLIN